MVMFVCVYLYICACAYGVHEYICVCAFMRAYGYVCLCTRVCIYIYACMYAFFFHPVVKKLKALLKGIF